MTTDFLSGKNDPRINLTTSINFARDPWLLYSIGYLEAANSLVAGLEQGTISASQRDKLLYPIAFLYRHHIELRIKQLYFKVCRFLGVRPQYRINHSLLVNWSDFKPKLNEAAQSLGLTQVTDAYLQQVDVKLNQFAQLDHTSMTFRYPVDKDGSNLLAGRTAVHLGQLRDFAVDLAQDLENIDLELSEWLNFQSDWFSNLEFADTDEDE